jgi:hypothetical protein
MQDERSIPRNEDDAEEVEAHHLQRRSEEQGAEQEEDEVEAHHLQRGDPSQQKMAEPSE